MNLHQLVVDTERKSRFLERTQYLVISERAQRIRTAEVQSALFVKRLLSRCKRDAKLAASQKQMA